MTSAVGFVNSFGGKTILSSGNNTSLINVTLPSQGGTLLTSANGILPGTIQSFAFNTAPSGWLACDGTALKRTTYPELFQAIGITFNTGGEAADEFRLPNMGGQFLRGWVAGQTVDAGRVFGSLQQDAFEQHTHSVTDPGHTHYGSVGSSGGGFGTSPANFMTNSQGNQPGVGPDLVASVTKITIGNSPNGGTETRPQNIAILFCIYTGQTNQFYVTKSTATDGTPAGVVMYSAAQNPPNGWLVCDGSAVSKTVYAALFNAIGTTFGSDATTFNLPGLKGQFVRGWSGPGPSVVDPSRVFGSLQQDTFESHTHTDSGHNHLVYPQTGSNGNNSDGNNYGTINIFANQGGARYSDNASANITETGGVETRPTNVALLPIIKY
jgi:microcystin-dependent protein